MKQYYYQQDFVGGSSTTNHNERLAATVCGRLELGIDPDEVGGAAPMKVRAHQILSVSPCKARSGSKARHGKNDSGKCSASFLAPVTPTTTMVGVTSLPYILVVGGWEGNN